MLTSDQVENYNQQDFVLLKNVVPAGVIRNLHRSLDAWIELSKSDESPFGYMLDGRPRFDLEPGHCADSPALRRVAALEELADVWLKLLTEGPVVKSAADLVVPMFDSITPR
ncbi:MAG: hypothetical protein ACR2QW_11545 [bacterium]